MQSLMSSVEPNMMSVVWFSIAWAVAAAGWFYLAGSLPLSQASDDVRTATGYVLVVTNTALALVATVVALLIAVHELRWTSMVVVGGFLFLFAPFVIQDLPARLRDTRAGMLLLLIVSVGTLGVLQAVGALTRAIGYGRALLG